MAEPRAAERVREYVESVWNAGDPAALPRLTTTGFTYHLGGQPGRDRSAMKAFLESIREAFPDWRVEISGLVAEGDEVAVRWTGTATHEGDFHGIPATGKRVRVCGINMYRVENGRIAEEWEQMDSIGLLRPLGVGA